MKTIKISGNISVPNDMNQLVETICTITNQDSRELRDRFKMVTKPNPAKITDLCKELKLRVEFDYTVGKGKAIVFIIVNNDYELNPKEETPEEPKPAEEMPEKTPKEGPPQLTSVKDEAPEMSGSDDDEPF